MAAPMKSPAPMTATEALGALSMRLAPGRHLCSLLSPAPRGMAPAFLRPRSPRQLTDCEFLFIEPAYVHLKLGILGVMAGEGPSSTLGFEERRVGERDI